MNGNDLDEAEYIIKLLKSLPEEKQKEQLLIVVSSVMTWMRTPKKLKKNMPKKTEQDDSETEEMLLSKIREVESETEDDPLNPGNKVLYFQDKDFNLRVPSTKYQQVKTLEMVALSA